jgi:hypothetical protein
MKDSKHITIGNTEFVVNQLPRFEKVRGTDGGEDHVNKNSNDYTVSVPLKRSSPVSNTGKFPLTIKDLNGTDLFTAPQAWIQDDPSAEEVVVIANKKK